MTKMESTKNDKDLIYEEVIEQKILNLRGMRVMLDHDRALLYGITTKRLNEQVRRNIKDFRRISYSGSQRKKNREAAPHF